MRRGSWGWWGGVGGEGVGPGAGRMSTSEKASGISDDIAPTTPKKAGAGGVLRWVGSVLVTAVILNLFLPSLWQDSIHPLIIRPAISLRQPGVPHSYTFREAGGSRLFRFGEVEGADEENVFAVGVDLTFAIVNDSDLQMTIESLAIVVDGYESETTVGLAYDPEPAEVPLPEGPHLAIIPKRFVVRVEPSFGEGQEDKPTLRFYTVWYPRQTLDSGDERYALQEVQPLKELDFPYDQPVDILGRTGLLETRGADFDVVSDIPPNTSREFSGKVFLACPGMLTFRLRVKASYTVPFLFGYGWDMTASRDGDTYTLINSQPPGRACEEPETGEAEEYQREGKEGKPPCDTWDVICATIVGEGPIHLTGGDPTQLAPFEEWLRDYVDLMGLEREPEVLFIPPGQYFYVMW